MSDVFISHVEEDHDIAEEIARGLERDQYTTWYYERDSLPGPPYLVQTSRAIEEAKAVVLVISRDSLSSGQVDREVVRAHESGKYVMPVLKDISHVEFQNCRPEWRMVLGASTSISIPSKGVRAIVPRIVRGLKNLYVAPRGELFSRPIDAEPDRPVEPEQRHHPRRMRPATLSLIVLAFMVCLVPVGLWHWLPQALIERNPQALFERGQMRLTKGDLSHAIADFTRVIDRRSDFSEAYLARVTALRANGQLDVAIADLGKAIQLNARDVAAY